MLKCQSSYAKTFLLYPNLKELHHEVFINLSLNEIQNYDSQTYFTNIISVLNDIVYASPEKEPIFNLFQILFEEIIFVALRNPGPTYVILKCVGDILKKYDLKHHFNCNIDIFNLMVQLVEYIKNHERTHNHTQTTKIEACFYILQHYLHNNLDKIDFFGQNLGLVKEILEEGVFKVPLNAQEGPKYQTNENLKAAFNTLALLGKSERNFIAIANYLMAIHNTGIWRNSKNSSWALYANIKRRSHKYAGLKNLGCSKILTFLTHN